MAQEQSTAPATCDTPQHHQMDFWVGDWQVFDNETQQLVAFDRVEKQYAGRIIQENLVVRLSDVAPDERVTRVSYQVLNLTHRASHEQPSELEPGRFYDVAVTF